MGLQQPVLRVLKTQSLNLDKLLVVLASEQLGLVKFLNVIAPKAIRAFIEYHLESGSQTFEFTFLTLGAACTSVPAPLFRL